jgi:outer membrane protein assembly factor BamB
MSDEDDCSGAGVLCLDASSGKPRWNVIADSSIKSSAAYDAEGDVCAAVSICGTVYMMEVSSGRIIWSEMLPGHPHRWIFTSPVVDDGVVFAGAKSGYAAMDVEDGSRIWYSELEGNDAWCCYASPVPYGSLVVAMLSRRGVIALRKSDGGIEWETELPVEYHYAPHLISGNFVLTGGEREELVLLDADTGEIEWKCKLSGKYPTSLSMTEDNIYATTSEGYLQCIDRKIGGEVWTYQSGKDLLDLSPYTRGERSILARPLLSGKDIFLPGCDGFIHVIDVDTGSCRRRIDLGSPITAGPCRTDRGICVGTRDGSLYLFGEDTLRN